MNVSSRPSLQPPNRRTRSLRLVTGLFTKNPLSKRQLVDDTEKTRLFQVENSSPVKDGISIGAAVRNEKIENALSIANAVRLQRQQQTDASASTSTSLMQNALSERLEANLLKNEIECTELRKLTEFRRRGIPVSLSMPNLGCDPGKDSCLGDSYLLKKLEASLLVKEDECTKIRKLLLVDSIKRGLTRTQKDPTHCCVSLSTQLNAPKSVLRQNVLY
jgi:hypothetical protein